MAITIDRSDGLYIARCLYEDRLLLSRAGFIFKKELKRWVTADDDVARKFYDDCVGAAKQRLDNIDVVKKQLIEASFAEDYDGDLLCPKGLAYLPFQRAGIAYALDRTDTLIADQPGLGKTIQALGIVNNIPTAGNILIVVPASLKINWFKEATRWLMDDLTIGIAKTKQKTKILEDGTKKNYTEYYWPDTNVVIINYEALPNYREQVEAGTWDILICDEAHVLKNSKSSKCMNIFGGGKGKDRFAAIKAFKRIFLTGTPILNKPLDLWPMIEAFALKEFGNYIKFIKRYCAAFETPWGHWDTTGSDHLEEFQEKLRATFMIRRMKADVLKDLPPKRRQIITLPSDGLSKYVKKEKQVFADNLKNLMILNGEKTEEDYEEWSDAELRALIDGIHERTKNFDDLDDFDDYDATHFEAIAHAREEIGLAKLPMIIEYVKSILDTDEKCVVLCVHRTVAHKLGDAFEGSVKFIGGMTDKEKNASVEAFQYDPDCRVFIGNINAAGVGITLTAAWNLVMAELCFVPALLEQGEDRIHRIGQLDHALIHYLIVEGSLESRLIEIIMEKQEMIKEALDRK